MNQINENKEKSTVKEGNKNQVQRKKKVIQVKKTLKKL